MKLLFCSLNMRHVHECRSLRYCMMLDWNLQEEEGPVLLVQALGGRMPWCSVARLAVA